MLLLLFSFQYLITRLAPDRGFPAISQQVLAHSFRAPDPVILTTQHTFQHLGTLVPLSLRVTKFLFAFVTPKA
jgi:hypothetical protein